MSIEVELRRLADGLIERSNEIRSAIRERGLAEVPEFYASNDPALLDVEERSIDSALHDIFAGLGHGRTPPATPSAAAVEEARVSAQAGLDLQALLRTYRVGHAVTWEAILLLAEENIADSDTRLAVLTIASRYQFEWNDRVMAALVQIYQQERDLLFRDRERKKRELVRDLLAGLPVDAGQLAYNVRGDHLAVVAWGAAPDQAMVQFAAALDGSMLVVTGTAGALYAWIHSTVQGRWRQLATQFEPPPDTCLALGDPANGVSGFRRTHRQALHAYRVARVHVRPVTFYSEVALEALVVRDLACAREFVDHVLGGIAGEDHRNHILRETLSAYFRAGQNASSAAHSLGVHERTVAYRLRSIEQRVGTPIATRREELAVALRLFDLLAGSEVAAAAADPLVAPALA